MKRAPATLPLPGTDRRPRTPDPGPRTADPGPRTPSLPRGPAQVGAAAARAYLSEFDKDGDGVISYTEFVTKVIEVGMGVTYDREADPMARYREVFDTFDTNGDGNINAKELQTLARHLKIYPTERDVLLLLKDYDVNADGKVSGPGAGTGRGRAVPRPARRRRAPAPRPRPAGELPRVPDHDAGAGGPPGFGGGGLQEAPRRPHGVRQGRVRVH